MPLNDQPASPGFGSLSCHRICWIWIGAANVIVAESPSKNPIGKRPTTVPSASSRTSMLLPFSIVVNVPPCQVSPWKNSVPTAVLPKNQVVHGTSTGGQSTQKTLCLMRLLPSPVQNSL